MMKIIALICVIASVVFAVLLEFWLRGKKGTDRDNAKLYAILSGRNTNFRNFHYIPVCAAQPDRAFFVRIFSYPVEERDSSHYPVPHMGICKLHCSLGTEL